MRRLSSNVIRALVLGALAVLVVGAGYLHFFARPASNQVSASFTSGVGIYPGTPVDILGIKVGQVDKVTPVGATVTITMSYARSHKVPANPIAVIVANSLVSDRYIELGPAYTGSGPVLADHARIPVNRTASPAELDDIYGALNKLSVALGPTGANKTGALSSLVNVAAANLQGNGAALGQSITALSQAAKTLADGSGDLFGTVSNLQKFTQALADSDSQVRTFENQLAQVSSQLANERADLGAALHNLTQALAAISGFVKDNASKIHTDLTGLADVTGVLTKEQGSLDETLAVAPVALANLVHAYDPNSGTIDERTNLDSLTDPSQVCGLLQGIVTDDHISGGLLGGLLGNLLGPLSTQISQACSAVSNGIKAAGGSGLPDLTGPLGSLLGGVTLPQIPGAN
jgi:phospholipid/cholesterol/gamma-HCH transport system substrate-binding protein